MEAAAAPPATPAGPAAPSQPSAFPPVLLQVLGAIGAGIGVLGFVIFFGGAIEWVRFHAIGVPAAEAVSHVPREDLVAVGAEFLVPAVAGALLGLAVVFFFYDRLSVEPTAQKKRDAEASRVAAAGNVRTLEKVLGGAQAELEAAQAERDRMDAAYKAASAPAHVAAAKTERDQANAALTTARNTVTAQTEALTAAQQSLVTAQAAVASAGELTPGERRKSLGVVGGGLGLSLLLIFIGAVDEVRGSFEVAALAAAGLFVIYLSRLAFDRTGRFRWFAVAAFVGLGIYSALATYFKAEGNPRVQGVGLILKGGAPLPGVFVAQTPDDVYIAQLVPQREDPGEFYKERSRMLTVPRSEVTDIAVGPLMKDELAHLKGYELAASLCRQPRERPRDVKEPKRISGRSLACPRARIKELDERLDEGRAAVLGRSAP